ncbi:snRNA-activating protein complex subunit 3 isoform X1 [Hypomesus transpacificus]|uniref:snRNA-activating protein complex subunit 3 isoform X1 n=1 Tax=Hypomesus transpacificus TaxID=137520 RepID=UPI001F08673D|nr:snRNA-activating protein complex subunit 3 isoform X1 [Hypomesus transpacificus]
MAAKGKSKVNENIPVDEFKDINTKRFHIGSFQNEWLTRLDTVNYSYQQNDPVAFDEEFAKEFGIATETFDELKSICSVDSLRCHPEDESPETTAVPPDTTLQTLIQRKKKEDYKNSLNIDKTNRSHIYEEQLESIALCKKPDDLADLVPEGEIILSIRVYQTATFERYNAVRPHATLQMLGSHYLTDLRDAVGCVSDLHVFGELSNTPDMAPDFVSKDHHKSAYFYFEHVFYNDMRFPECQDISATTIEWAKTRDFPSFSQAKMEDTKFSDLKVKVGYPYLYCHQGDCEHLVLITDIRCAHMDDCLDRKMYPLQTHKNLVHTNKCAVCNIYIARWLTTSDQLALSDPCLFCDKCFRMLHYDKKGRKLADFNAYVYVDPAVFS